MAQYISRLPWKTKPAITWKVTKNSSRQGLQHIIDELKRRYNPITTDKKFEMDQINIPQLNIGTRVKANIKKDNQYYGNVAMQYQGVTVDTSTFENKIAQKFSVFFNMKNDETSYQERDHFIE